MPSRHHWRHGYRALGLCVLCGFAMAAQAATLRTLRSGTAHSALYGLCFDAGYGAAVGAQGALLESSDGGEHWQAAATLTPLALLAVDCRANRALAVGQSGSLLRREAGVWSLAPAISAQRLLGVSLNSRGQAAAVGEFGTVLWSDDAGRSWRDARPDWERFAPEAAEPHLYAVQVEESGQLTVAGEFGLILRSADAGHSWQSLRAADPAAPAVHALALDSRPGVPSYAAGQSGLLLKSGDGGRSWQTLPASRGNALLGLAAADAQTVLLAGLRTLRISRDGGASFSEVPLGKDAQPWYQNLRVSPVNGRYYAVGYAGRLVELLP